MKKHIIITLAAVFLAAAMQAYAGNLEIQSDSQEFKDSEKKIYLEGNVKVKTEDADVMSPRASAEIDPETNKVKKVEFKEHAYSYSLKNGKMHEIKAQILDISLLNKFITAEGNTLSSITENDKPLVIVTADKQEYHKNENVMKAFGRVNILYKDTETFSDEALVYLDDKNDVKKIILTGNAKLNHNADKISADKLSYDNIKEEAEAFGNVYTDISEKDAKRLEVWSDYQFYDRKKNFVTASGSAVIKYEDYNAQGPKVNVYSDEKTKKLNEAVFLGRSTIETQGRTVTADRITITMNPKDFKASGHVKSVIPNFNAGNMQD